MSGAVDKNILSISLYCLYLKVIVKINYHLFAETFFFFFFTFARLSSVKLQVITSSFCTAAVDVSRQLSTIFWWIRHDKREERKKKWEYVDIMAMCGTESVFLLMHFASFWENSQHLSMTNNFTALAILFKWANYSSHNLIGFYSLNSLFIWDVFFFL